MKVVILFLFVGLLLALAIWLPRAEGAKVILTPEELREKMAEAGEGVKTFRTKGITETKTVVDGKTIESSSLMKSVSQVDLINQRTMTVLTTETRTPIPEAPEMVMVVETEIYWLDGMMYVKTAMEGMPPAWMKIEVPWVCPLEQAAGLLRASEVEILRVEEINGIETYAIRIIPDIGKLLETLRGPSPMGPGMELAPEVVDVEGWKAWVCRDTFHTVKEQSHLTVMLGGMEIETTSIVQHHSINEPVTIELPAEGRMDEKFSM